jgi:3-isopropylmalate/(R)-2-methylmalate dehydratase small subunit
VALPEPEVRALMRASEAEISLPDQYVAFDGHNVLFDIDEEIKNRLLNGLDDIALTLSDEDAISAYEHERERRGPVTTALG